MSVPAGTAGAVLKQLRDGLCLQIAGDSQVLVNCCRGRASTCDPALVKPIRVAMEALQQAVTKFGVSCFLGRDLVAYTPCGDNSAADAAANAAVDTGSFELTMPMESQRFMECWLRGGDDQIGLLFSSDGASRGNPGPSSFGTCAWWGRWAGDRFTASGQLFQKGVVLGRRTNNYAEAHGMAAAEKSALHYLFWLAEGCAKAAAKRDYM